MKRFEQKVRDIVEVRPFSTLTDYSASPALTVDCYHFTVATADLMSGWLDTVAGIKSGRGSALALAGFRGVGKSHFFAAFGALLSRPELRSRVSDAHVEACAQTLSRRAYNVAQVQRGSDVSLLVELKTAIAECVGGGRVDLSDSPNELLHYASEKSGDLPLVILIDTVTARDSLVTRDDGIFLGEIAETAVNLGIFVAIALDDDIAGADGVNASIARTFAIHYLDQEHLYKIVEAAIFPKHEEMRSVLHDVYSFYRESLVEFRWSEPRFTSLYPLHPAIMEIAPFIRLYLHDFALLGFAAEAGVRIMGRPASSLIAMDEVFDNVEKSLRKVESLKEIFAAFDKIEVEIIGQIAVMQRLRAKLILKGLLLLSLNSGGATASDLCAALLILDETGDRKSVDEIDELLRKFEASMPDKIAAEPRDGGETVFSFKLKGTDDLTSSLAEAVTEVPLDVIPTALRRLTAEKFSDLKSGDTEAFPADCSVVWRGSTRRGRLIWDSDATKAGFDEQSVGEIDWTVIVNCGPSSINAGNRLCQVEWRIAELQTDEIDTIRRYHILQANTDLRERFSDYLSAAIQSHSIAVEKIWKRTLFVDGCLVIDGIETRFSEDAMSAHTISQLFKIMLEPSFERSYPQHPYFTQTLGNREASTLISDFFGGGQPNSTEVQELARIFAHPLGLVTHQDEICVPETAAALMELPVVKESFHCDDPGSEDVIPIADVTGRMSSTPYGLSSEAQHLVLVALVAQHKFEFVTASGNRINWRSLDLQIIWNDIVGLAAPEAEVYSSDRLLHWASAVTGNIAARSLNKASDRSDLTKELSSWLTKWQDNDLSKQFEALPDENLNSRIWRRAANLKRSFGTIAESVSELIQDKMPVDQCLVSVADTFSDSDAEFAARSRDLTVVQEYLRDVNTLDKVCEYLARAESTDNLELEQMREKLAQIIDDGRIMSSASSNEEITDLFDRYQRLYSDLYIRNHDSIMNSTEVGDNCSELMRTDDWFEFENLSRLGIFDDSHMSKTRALTRELNQFKCNFDTGELLKDQANCNCSFSFSRMRFWKLLPGELSQTIRAGLESYRKAMYVEKQSFIDALSSFDGDRKNKGLEPVVTELLAKANNDGEFCRFSAEELHILQIAAENSDIHERISHSNNLNKFTHKDLAVWEDKFDEQKIDGSN